MVVSIQLLNESIINQIAAGEVIENATSVVKELVENSIDAKADVIAIHIEAGGIRKIKVSDNGIGMNKEEISLCLERHATSKIRSFDDLFSIKTMGFRGEALASIASVSKMVIESSKDNDGYALTVEGGKKISFSPYARQRGTTITVRSLFYNVPARKKFQKTILSINKDICKLLYKIALANPLISFHLEIDGKKIVFLPKVDKYSNRVKEVLGEEIFSSMIPISFTRDIFKVIGFIGLPNFAKKNRASQYLLINKRVVYCKLLSDAIREGYGTRIAEGFFPIFVLHFSILGNYIDINVHPQKKEIRLSEENYFKKEVADIISLSFQRKASEQNEKRNVSFSFDKEVYIPSRNEEIFTKFQDFEQKELFSTFDDENKFFPLFVIGTYFFVESKYLAEKLNSEDKEEDSIVIIDLVKAYARSLFDKVCEGLKNDGIFESTRLTTPVVIDFPLNESIFLENILPVLSKMGIEASLIGENTVCIDAIPSFLNKDDIEELFFIFLEGFSITDIKKGLKDIQIQKMATKISRIAGNNNNRYSIDEANLLVKELLNCKDPFISPLGDPIMTKLTQKKMKQIFHKL